MKQNVKVVRKHDEKKELIKGLQLEIDYELASLYDAMQNNNEFEAEKSKARLKEINSELKDLEDYYLK
jgi:hypothetical protein